METIKPVERPGCWFLDCPNLAEADSTPCCSSHGHPLCHRCYRRTHFVEVCRCGRPECAKELAESSPVVSAARAQDEPVRGRMQRWWTFPDAGHGADRVHGSRGHAAPLEQ